MDLLDYADQVDMHGGNVPLPKGLGKYHVADILSAASVYKLRETAQRLYHAATDASNNNMRSQARNTRRHETYGVKLSVGVHAKLGDVFYVRAKAVKMSTKRRR